MSQTEQMRWALQNIYSFVSKDTIKGQWCERCNENVGAGKPHKDHCFNRFILRLAEKALVFEPVSSVEDNSQDWRGMTGMIAWQLIQRHADNWADIDKMMNEWLEANKPEPKKLVRLTDEEIDRIAMLRASPLFRLMTERNNSRAVSEAFNDIASAIMDELIKKNGGDK